MSFGLGLVSLSGRFDLAFLPLRISMGLGRLGETGVVLMHRRARSGSFLACRAIVKVVFTVWIWRSMKPLDLGYLGDDVK